MLSGCLFKNAGVLSSIADDCLTAMMMRCKSKERAPIIFISMVMIAAIAFCSQHTRLNSKKCHSSGPAAAAAASIRFALDSSAKYVRGMGVPRRSATA